MFEECGVDEVEEIAGCDRQIRVLQARQVSIVARMYDKRLELGRRLPTFSLEAGKVAQSVIAEVAMARQISASAAANQFGFALGLRSMTATSRLFAEGRISERIAKAVVDEVGGLSADDAVSVDFDLAGGLADMTARQAGAAARKLVLEIDPHASRHAANTARRGRHISIHVLPHSMASISMRLPAEQAVAVYKALDNIAQGLKYEGDPRTASQIMCDTAVERITGQQRAGDIAVEVGILMTEGSLLGDEDVPALLQGYGPVPAAIARQLATASRAWLRRLFTDPISGSLVDRDPTRRRFDGPLAGFVRDRDQQCRRPYCDCRIRDLDHQKAYNGSNTTVDNAQGLCKRSHTTKHLPGWKVETTGSGTVWTTPTGHTYASRRPDLHGYGPKRHVPNILDTESAMEHRLSTFLYRPGLAQPSLHRRQ